MHDIFCYIIIIDYIIDCLYDMAVKLPYYSTKKIFHSTSMCFNLSVRFTFVDRINQIIPVCAKNFSM